MIFQQKTTLLPKNDWKEGDEVDVILPMDVHQVVSNENLKSNKGLCAYGDDRFGSGQSDGRVAIAHTS